MSITRSLRSGRRLTVLAFAATLGAAAAAGAAPGDWAGRVDDESGAFALLGDLEAGRLYSAGATAVGDARVPAGSWVKPFLAYALLTCGKTDENEIHLCEGWRDPLRRCWYGPGHGRLNLEQALAKSCNAWFQCVTPRLEPGQYQKVNAPFFPAGWSDAITGSAAAEEWQNTFIAGRLTARSLSFDAWSRALAALVLGRRVDWPAGMGVRELVLGPPVGDPAARVAVRRGLQAAAAGGTALELARRFGSADLWVKTSSSQSPYGDQAGRRPDAVCMVVAFWPTGHPRAFIALFVPRGMAATTAAPLAGDVLRDFCRWRRMMP